MRVKGGCRKASLFPSKRQSCTIFEAWAGVLSSIPPIPVFGRAFIQYLSISETRSNFPMSAGFL